MEQINLTKKHKSRLLEMSRVLFPEYKYWYLHDGTCDFCTENTLDYSLEEDPQWNSWNRIHWFEFCSRYLMSKLDKLYFEKVMYPVDPYSEQNRGKELSYPDNWEALWSRRPFLMFTNNLNGIVYKCHPIDYLYSEFKKLN